MAKYLTENKVRKLANKTVTGPLAAYASQHGINPNQLSNYLSGYLPRCPPALQEALGLERVTLYREIDNE
jgi:hypothetical protein